MIIDVDKYDGLSGAGLHPRPAPDSWWRGRTAGLLARPPAIGARIDAADRPDGLGHGYDHNWVLRGGGKEVAKAAELFDPTSGIVLQVFTDQPGLQFYSGNFLDGTIHGKQGVVYYGARRFA